MYKIVNTAGAPAIPEGAVVVVKRDGHWRAHPENVKVDRRYGEVIWVAPPNGELTLHFNQNGNPFDWETPDSLTIPAGHYAESGVCSETAEPRTYDYEVTVVESGIPVAIDPSVTVWDSEVNEPPQE